MVITPILMHIIGQNKSLWDRLTNGKSAVLLFIVKKCVK